MRHLWAMGHTAFPRCPALAQYFVRSACEMAAESNRPLSPSCRALFCCMCASLQVPGVTSATRTGGKRSLVLSRSCGRCRHNSRVAVQRPKRPRPLSSTAPAASSAPTLSSPSSSSSPSPSSGLKNSHIISGRSSSSIPARDVSAQSRGMAKRQCCEQPSSPATLEPSTSSPILQRVMERMQQQAARPPPAPAPSMRQQRGSQKPPSLRELISQERREKESRGKDSKPQPRPNRFHKRGR